ncbi:MAG: glutamyl-tRNA reductase [Deltaproteobacteria bacterium RIFCSPHIGHO2_02_FULL_40_11]|nr:MAG: glutamyl-tRNA reductase [Deltaproteobacteria bacterium RIFCSPHIGHO2_02_FULL_40_11]
MSVYVVGMNHHKTPVELREKFHALDPADFKNKFRELGVEEGCFLSTCNRVELHTVGAPQVRSQIHQWISGASDEDLSPYLYMYDKADAIRHMFRVASSLDSMVVGEAEILGQMKSAYQKSHELGLLGPKLHRVYQKAFQVAKRVRSETGVGQHPISIASVAIDLTQKIFQTLEDKIILILGAGEMARIMVEHLRAKGVTQFYVSNRSTQKEEGFKYLPLDQFPSILDKVDMILASTGAASYLVTSEMLQEALKQRKNKPIFCIDISVPRNIDPMVNRLDNIYLYDIDDLEILVRQNSEMRKEEALKAEKIILEEVDLFYPNLEKLNFAPTLKRLREKIENIHEEEMGVLQKKLLHLTAQDIQVIEKSFSRFSKKLLHDPLTQIKASSHHQDHGFLETLKQLFKISP